MAQIAMRASAALSASNIKQKGVYSGLLEKTELSCQALKNEASKQGGQKGQHRGPLLRPWAGKSQLDIGSNEFSEKKTFPRNVHPPVRSFTKSREHDMKVHAERTPAEARVRIDSETAASERSDGHLTRPEPSSSSNLVNGHSIKGAIAVEAATHFKQFKTVLQVLEGHERAVKAEVGQSEAAQVYQNGSWPVLLGLSQGDAVKGGKSLEVITLCTTAFQNSTYTLLIARLVEKTCWCDVE